MDPKEQMSAPMSPNPYAGDLGTLHALAQAKARPTGITVTSVLSIVAGLMGGMFALLTLLNIVFGNELMTVAAPAEGASNAQQEMITQMQEIGKKYMVFNGALGLATFVLSVALILGGIGLLMTKFWSRTLLRRTFLAAILLEIVATILYTITQLDMMPVMSGYMQSMSGPKGNMSGAAAESLMRVFTYVGMAMWGAWALAKCGLYFWGRRYLNRPAIVAFFNAPEATSGP